MASAGDREGTMPAEGEAGRGKLRGGFRIGHLAHQVTHP